MGLIKCPDCNKMFSDRIKACPECGCPIEEAIREQNTLTPPACEETTTVPEPPKNKPVSVSFETHENKSQKMTLAEFNDFAIRSVIPEIKKELNCSNIQFFKTDEIEYPGLLLKTDVETIWLDIIIEVAPMFKSFIVNWENSKKANENGWKYAVAHIAVGSKDPVRFDRRIILKNDAYYIRYEGLKYFDYPKNSNIRYSLSEDTYDYIYKKKEANPLLVVKETKNYRQTYRYTEATQTIIECWDKYNLPSESKEYLSKYLIEIGEAIDYCIPLKDTLLNFLNCVDYCKGLLFADSMPLLKQAIIPACHKILDSNTLIDLSAYDNYMFSYMIYYYLITGEHLGVCESSGYLNLQKIKLFEEKPAYFGFYNITEKKRKQARKNSSENVFNMYLKINHFLTKDFLAYQQLNSEINEESKRKPTNYQTPLSKFKSHLSCARENYSFLICNFDKNKKFADFELYSLFYKVTNEYSELLQKDCRIYEKLLSKNNGGKYGFFEYKKDLKTRDEQLNTLSKHVDELKRIFTMPIPSANTKIMVPFCSHYFNDLKDKYLSEVKENPSSYNSFHQELCAFYDKALLTSYDNKYKPERDFFVLNIAKFIDLLEMKKNNDDEDMIYDKEEEIFDDMEIIRENTYKMIIM